MAWDNVANSDVTISRYNLARKAIGVASSNTRPLAPYAMRWLADQHGDLHVEFHKDFGWQVSTCFSDGKWSEDGWVRGDGTLLSALIKAVELTEAGGVGGDNEGKVSGNGSQD